MVVPQKGSFIVEHPFKMDALGVPPFTESPRWMIIIMGEYWDIHGYSPYLDDDGRKIGILWDVIWDDITEIMG